MSAAGSKRVNVVHRKFIVAARRARRRRRVSTTSGQSGERRMRREPRRGVGLRRRTTAPPTTRQPRQNTRTSCTPAGSRPTRNCARQLAHRIAEPEPARPSSPRSPRARCSRACPSTGSRTRRGRSPDGVRARTCVERGAEVPQVDVAIGHAAGTWSATAAPRRGCGTRSPSPRAGSARLHDRGGERVVAGLAVRPQRRTAGITSGNSGDSSSCSRSPMKKSSWRGLPTTVAGIDRVAPCASRSTSNTG